MLISAPYKRRAGTQRNSLTSCITPEPRTQAAVESRDVCVPSLGQHAGEASLSLASHQASRRRRQDTLMMTSSPAQERETLYPDSKPDNYRRLVIFLVLTVRTHASASPRLTFDPGFSCWLSAILNCSREIPNRIDFLPGQFLCLHFFLVVKLIRVNIICSNEEGVCRVHWKNISFFYLSVIVYVYFCNQQPCHRSKRVK